MGQRLTVKIRVRDSGETLAIGYWHWSGYTAPAAEICADIMDELSEAASEMAEKGLPGKESLREAAILSTMRACKGAKPISYPPEGWEAWEADEGGEDGGSSADPKAEEARTKRERARKRKARLDWMKLQMAAHGLSGAFAEAFGGFDPEEDADIGFADRNLGLIAFAEDDMDSFERWGEETATIWVREDLMPSGCDFGIGWVMEDEGAALKEIAEEIEEGEFETPKTREAVDAMVKAGCWVSDVDWTPALLGDETMNSDELRALADDVNSSMNGRVAAKVALPGGKEEWRIWNPVM